MRHLAPRVTIMIARAGFTSNIVRKTKGAKDGFGKSSLTWGPVATEPVALDMSGGSSMNNFTFSGGETSLSTPVLYFIADSEIQVDDHVRVDNILYEVGEPVSYPTHKVAEATAVDESV